MDLNDLKPRDYQAMLGTLSGPLTRRITDYLNGHQLGPPLAVTIQGPAGEVQARASEQLVTYWAGDLLPSSHPKFPQQVTALRKSFTFRNVTLEGIETLADGIGVDEPDWGFTIARPLQENEKPTPEEEALIRELEAIITPWWDARDVPTLSLNAVIPAIAHGRQAIRPRITDQAKDDQGRLRVVPPEQSLDGLHLELPDVADSGLYQDKATLKTVGITRVEYGSGTALRDGWEFTFLDEDGNTVLRSVRPDGTVSDSTPMNLGGQLFLLEIKFRRGVVKDDVLSLQNARNVATTNLSRNTRWAAFEKTIMIGVDPPLDEQGNLKPLSGPGAESYLQPAMQTEVEETGQRDSQGQPVTITRERMYPGASVTKLDPSDPKAIQAAIDQADEDLYSIMRQRFMLTAASDASGRKSEVSAGPFLRATARYAATVEAYYRNLLMFAARISAIAQGKPGRYDTLRPVVSCKQMVFEPSAEMIAAYVTLQEKGVWSMQTTRTATGRSDPDAEQQQIDRERAAAPPPDPKPDPAPDPGPS